MSNVYDVRPTEVAYPLLTRGSDYMRVDLLSQDTAVGLADEVLRLVVASYSEQFENRTKQLPQGTFAETYDTDAKREKFRDQVIPGVYERGGSYLAVRQPDSHQRLAGVLKVLPGAAIEDRFADMAAIAEVLTDPQSQGQRIGSAMIHTHLMLQEPDVRGVVLDAFIGNPVNEWYERMGLEYETHTEPLTFVNGQELASRYMVTAPGKKALHVAHYLMTQVPSLQYPVARFKHKQSGANEAQ